MITKLYLFIIILNNAICENKMLETVAVHKIHSYNLHDNSFFGWSVGVYESYTIIGSYGGYGSAQIWRKNIVENEQSFNKVAELFPEDTTGICFFGYSVGIYDTSAIVGCPGSNHAGYAFIYYRNTLNDEWNLSGKFASSISNENTVLTDFYGGSVSIFGSYAAVSAWTHDHVGAVYIYVKRNEFQWIFLQRIVGQDSTYFDYFGRSVSIGENTLLIGAHCDDDRGYNSGSAYIFVFHNYGWSQEAKLVGDDSYIADNFGESVSLYGDVAVIGAKYTEADRSTSLETGAVYIFERSVTSSGDLKWEQRQKLVSNTATPYSSYGASVSVHGDYIVVGALGEVNEDTIQSGSAFVYQRNSEFGYWDFLTKLQATKGGREGDYFGKAVAVDSKSNLILVGAYGEMSSINESSSSASESIGVVYIFDHDTKTVASIDSKHSWNYTLSFYFGHVIAALIASLLMLFVIVRMFILCIEISENSRFERLTNKYGTNIRTPVKDKRPESTVRFDLSSSSNCQLDESSVHSEMELLRKYAPPLSDSKNRNKMDLIEMSTFQQLRR